MTLLCSNPECNVVQTVAPGANYYEVLGLSPEPKFDINIKQLRNKFLRIQQKIHPDSFSQNTNGDQVYAQQQSSLANKAYATLKEPLSRANYMLDLMGAPIHETESLDEPELLMQVMEARELLEDAKTEDEIQGLKSQNDERIKETVDGLSKAFQMYDLEKAKILAIELQYWIRIENVIRDWVAGHPIVADHV
jgi:molecular chaperone HscB